ncbi:MAG: two-component system, sensor histidine kinase YesM, partial [Clostridiales bacterium]|nr:two-component system, sensor histidine kinase YesM [Clostridiales bacterium]
MKENTKKKEKREYSLKKKVLVILMGSTVPIVLFLIFFNWFVLLEMNNRIAEASRNALFIQCQNMERNMAGIEMALLRITAEEAAFQKLAYSPSNEYDNYVNEYDTSLNLKKAMYPYDDWWASMVISVPKDVYRILYNTGSNSNIESPKIFYEIKDMAIKGNLKKVSKWYPIKVGKDSYLIRVLGYKDTYVVSIIDLKNVLLMQDNEEDNRTITMFYDEEKIYANVDFVALDNLQKKKNYSFVRIDGENYMLISSKLENSNLEVAYISP